ncbi:MAG: zinc ribbon domain-containing protein [Propionibacteriaceae bacterium]|nr:zinc ribbon domain-containing protein [Propionibacteriaceae bacterium]
MARVETICRNCGTNNPAATAFCTGCGQYLFDPATTSGPVPPAVPAGAGPAPAPNQPPTLIDMPAAAAPGTTNTWPRYCPRCGEENRAERHLCARCGQLLDPTDAWAGPGSGPARASSAGVHERSIPGWYRARGVIAAACAVVTIAAAATAWWGVVRRDGFMDALANAKQQTVPVAVTQAVVEPPASVTAKSKPAAVIDGTVTALTLTWNPQPEPSCAHAGTGWIVLTLAEPTRVRGIMLFAGLDSDPQRSLEQVPSAVGVSFDGITCDDAGLEAESGWSTIELDSVRPVATVWVNITKASSAPDRAATVSVTEIKVFQYQS